MDDIAQRRAKKAAYMREYTAKNRERLNARRRERRRENPDTTLAREKRWRAANRDKVLVYKKRDREKRPDDYARWKRTWAERNRDKILAKKRSDYQKNRHAIQARIDEAARRNPERHMELRAARWLRRRALLAQVPSERIDRDVVYNRDSGICQICGKHVARSQMSVDHIIPLSFRGPNTMSNVRLAHIRCNKARGNRGAAQMRLPLD